jgi:hypothetical protein
MCCIRGAKWKMVVQSGQKLLFSLPFDVSLGILIMVLTDSM